MITIDPLEAFYELVANDAEMKTLMAAKGSGDAAWFPQFPDRVLDESVYPRGTFFHVTGSSIGVTADEIVVQTDIWVWPTGTAGGSARVKAIDDRMLELLDSPNAKGANGTQWSHGTGRVFSRSVSWRDFPTAPDEPLRRRRDYRLRVS